jgi:hypothetical protein
MKQHRPDPVSTRTGIVFGSAIVHRERDSCPDAVLIQRALLTPSTKSHMGWRARLWRRLAALLS